MKSIYENSVLESRRVLIGASDKVYDVAKKHDITEEDLALFRATVDGVTPLPQKRVPPHFSPPPPRPLPREADEQQVLEDMFSDSLDPAEMETGEELLFTRNGLQHNVLRKLRRGQFSIAAELDLHGMRVEEARQALSQFLLHCRHSHKQCVRIIHGKGNGSRRQQPVLKGKVNHWLRQREEVLAFCSARQVDGGTGAIYLLLKRK
jgi:DNA-nicking Smr family endonuclease